MIYSTTMSDTDIDDFPIILEEIPIHKTQPWISAWIVNLSEISPNTSTFRARLEVNVYWQLSNDDATSYKAAIRDKTVRKWEPTWQPNFTPVNVSSIASMNCDIFAKGKSIVVTKSKKEDGNFIGRYTLLLDAVFTELYELKLFPYDVQDLSMDLQYQSHEEVRTLDVLLFRPCLKLSWSSSCQLCLRIFILITC